MQRPCQLMISLVTLLLMREPFCLAEDAPTKGILELVEMTKTGKCFSRDEYRKVRGAFVRDFEEQYRDVIKNAFGDDFDVLNQWFEKNIEVKEEFYSAIDQKKDDIGAALKIFHSLWKEAPDAVAKAPNLAIAFAVVWDDPRSIYDYRMHQERTHSTLPLGYMDLTVSRCFQDYISRQKELQAKDAINRLRVLPWEFLIYVVDHRTPLDERKWAAKNYLIKRKKIGTIYSTIKYDFEMLNSRGKVCRLNDKPYTLESVLQNGGVCAMQADFAARVGKSILVPAAYVSGESQFQELHAWVMWVEVNSANTSRVNFTLESHGRYQGDHYYTGQVLDPQTAEKILDRDMERRLSAVASDRVGKRQAELIMSHYDQIVTIRNLEQKKKILLLDKVLALSPYNEAAWTELARQVREGEIDMEAKQAVLARVEKMLTTFAKYPDFTWKLVDDLLKVQNGKLARNQFFERLVILYEKAERPDLACQARVRWSNYITEDKKWSIAARGLAQTMQKFPAEGRHLPKIIKELREVCEQFKGGSDFLGLQYQELLKKIPIRRGNEPNKFCIQMYEEAIAFFKNNKKDKIARDLESKLSSIKSARMPGSP